MSAIDDARRVAADMLRQAGDETGARVLGHADTAVRSLLAEVGYRHCCSGGGGEVHQNGCQVAAALHDINPEWWHEREVDRAWDEALVMARQRSDGPRLRPPFGPELGGDRIPPRPAFDPKLDAVLNGARTPEEARDITEAIGPLLRDEDDRD